MDYIAAIFSRLNGDVTLAGLLDSHGGSPAIFSGDLAPADYDFADLPAVVIGPTISAPDRDTFTERNREVLLSVRLYARRLETSKPLDDAAERVRALLHRWAGPPSCTVNGPQAAPTSGPEIAGREIVLTVFFAE